MPGFSYISRSYIVCILYFVVGESTDVSCSSVTFLGLSCLVAV